MKIEVVNIVEHDDEDGAMMIIDMDRAALEAMAKIGLLKVLTDAAEQAIVDHAEAPTDGV
jgi:hypothetical protein